MSRKSFIDTQSETAIFQQIVNETERQILVGELMEGDFLMSVREFASKHMVNPNTVAKAYRTLQQMNLVEPVRGKGLSVKKIKEQKVLDRKMDLIEGKVSELIHLSASLNITTTELIKLIQSQGKK